jgi:prepilin-type N-terminal cleavage/methylation domain-containing protein
MAQKYTISKVLTQNLRIENLHKIRYSNKGFTLIELITGLSIFLIVGGLALNALVEANAGFSKDKKSIDSNQNLSAVLEIIGNDIKQSGEQISESNFPTIEFNIADATLDPTLKPGSSKIVVRRSLVGQLTLCEAIAANQNLTTLAANNITVADNLRTTVNISPNCDVATASSPLSVYRVIPAITDPPTRTTYYPTTPATAVPSTPTPLTLKLPLALRNARDYRCQLDEPNPTTPYDSTANAGTDFCGGTGETLRIAVANNNGQFLIFNQTNEIADAGNTGDTVAKADTVTTSTKKYQIAVNTTFASGDSAIANNTKNNAAAYPIGSPIYVIEERAYTLTTDGSLQLSINGGTPQTLIKKIDNFIVSAKTYTNSTDRIVNPTPAGTSVNPVATSTTALTTANPICYSPTTPPKAVTNPQATDANATNPQYICKFNYFDGIATTDRANWKTLAGVKVELQAKYDSVGRASESSTDPGDIAQVAKDKEKLKAKAEFFPRNVLSK